MVACQQCLELLSLKLFLDVGNMLCTAHVGSDWTRDWKLGNYANDSNLLDINVPKKLNELILGREKSGFNTV